MFAIIGTTTIDLFISGLEKIPDLDGDEFTTKNLTLCDQPLMMVLGGNGANSSYVLATFGAPTTLYSAVGHDRLGEIASDWLRERNVNIESFVLSRTHATATTTIVMDNALNRVSFHHPGASQSLSLNDIPLKIFKEVKILLISSFSLLPKFGEEGFRIILNSAYEAGVITAVDIGPAIWHPTKLNQLIPILNLIDFIIANEHEIFICTDTKDLEAGADKLLRSGAKCAIVKRGKKGVIIRKKGLQIDVPGFVVETQYTVGAGDSFNAGFLYGIQKGMDLSQAARFGNAVAALIVSAKNGVLGCPSLEQVEAFLKK